MRIIRNIIRTLIIMVALGAAGFFLVEKAGLSDTFDFLNLWSCSKPITYSIGNIDSRFGLSQDQLKTVLASAEEVWEKPTGKNLFQYDDNGEIKINLIFDERQQQTIDSEKLKSSLDNLETVHQSIINQYNSLNSSYKKKLDDYNANVEEYKNKLDDYNREVAYWNKRGGASKDEYDKLKKEKSELEDMYKNLEAERVSVNNLVGQTNHLVQKENDVVDSYNASVETYKDKYGQSREFEKGVYNGKEINVYEFKEIADLRLTLVHELGHALGMNHVENPKSIMYYMLGEQDMNNPTPTQEDMDALDSVCRTKF